MIIGKRSLNFSEAVTSMTFEEFENYWNKTGKADSTGIDATKAAKKIGIKIPKPQKIEGGE